MLRQKLFHTLIATSIFIFFSLPVLAFDSTLTTILAAKDDTTKVNNLTRYSSKFDETDKAKAISILKMVVEVSKKIGYTFGIAQAWLDIGIINAQDAKDRLAVENFKTALFYFKKTNRIDKVASCLFNIGACAERYGDGEVKINSTLEAIKMLENTDHTKLIVHGYNSLGILFFNIDNFSKAQDYFTNARGVAQKCRDTVGLVQALFGISNCLASGRQFLHAYRYSKDALRLAEASNKKPLLLKANTCMSDLYTRWQKGEQAIAYSNEVLKYADQLGDVHHKLIAFLNLAEGYSLVNNQHQRIYYLRQALKIGRKNDVVVQLDDIYKGLSEGFQKLGNYNRALAYFKQYTLFKDSTINLKSNKAVAELEIKYQTAQKEKALSDKQLQILQKDLQLRKSREYTLYGIVASVAAFIIASLVYFNLRNKKKLHSKQLKSLQQEKELQILQAAMQGEEKERSRIAKDLHDGVAGMLAAVKMHFNSVSIQHECVLKAEAYRNGIDLLNEASYELRKTSHNLMPEVLLQYGLDIAMRRYCSNISNNEVLIIQYDSWGDIKRFKSSFELSVYRIVQELLNNIVKHSKANNAIVQLSQKNSILSITIEDNGVGFSRNKLPSEGMGMYSLRSRVEAINGSIELEGEPGSGVSAYLEFDTAGLETQDVVEIEKETSAVA